MRALRRSFRWPLIVSLVLAIACAVCLLISRGAANTLNSQKAAQRWRGESGQGFAQISCYLPAGESLSMEQLYNFRAAMAQKLKDASLDVEKFGSLYTDAWSLSSVVRVNAGRRSGEVLAVAVGGHFFDFHPLRLISGNYLSPDDLMEDRVLLDRETAWMLFGGTELSGMSFSLNGVPFVVAGVYEHADDRFTKRAEGEGMCIYMSYDAYARLFPDTKGVTCYEFVMAEPVKGFVRTAAEEKFPVKQAEILANSYRFEAGRLLRLVKDRAERSMRKSAALYPSWENAARMAEDQASFWLTAGLVCGLFPAALLIYAVIRFLAGGKKQLEEDLLPRARDRVEEAWRVRARKRWEKKHPDLR